MHRDPWHHGQVVVRGHSPLQLAQDYGGGAQVLGQTPLAGTAPTSWIPSILAYYAVEEASGGPYDAQGTCGADCDLDTITATPTQDTTNVREGSAAVDMDIGDVAACVNATCDEMNFVGDRTWGGWVRREAAAESVSRLMQDSSLADAFFLYVSPGPVWTCQISDAFTDILKAVGTTTISNDTYYHVACTYVDNGAGNNDDIEVHINGVGDGTVTDNDVSGCCSAASGDFSLSSASGNQRLAGQIDAAFVDDAAWTDAQVARDHACLAAGTLCCCSASAPTTYLPCFTDSDCQASAGCGAALCASGLCQGRNTAGNVLTACNAGAP
jgi:hypothetical protein